MRTNFVTYTQFEQLIKNQKNYSFEYTNNSLFVFYDYGQNDKTQEQLSIRQPLFKIDLLDAFCIVAPYGYRLINAKKMHGFNEIAAKALELSNTPIYKRGIPESR